MIENEEEGKKKKYFKYDSQNFIENIDWEEKKAYENL